MNEGRTEVQLACIYEVLVEINEKLSNTDKKQCLWKQGNVVCTYRKSNGGYVVSYIHNLLGVEQNSFETEEDFKKDYEILD